MSQVMAIELKSNEMNAVARIIVVGVGGAGNNAINRMIDDNIQGVEFIGINTDKQDLACCKAPKLIGIGERLTKGLGAGGDPAIGEGAAKESVDELEAAITGADMVFVTCGMGGGTGTGAAPIVAQISKELGILTVGIVTKPFSFEGNVRARHAEDGIAKLREVVDAIVVIKNDNIFKVVDDDIDANEAMKKADEVLENSLSGITNIINRQGDLNLDFADIKKAMTDKGDIYIGIGQASGDNKGVVACNAAIDNQLLETDIVGASDVVYYVQGKVKIKDFRGVGDLLNEKCGDQANVYGGFLTEDNENDSCTVTIIATGLHKEETFRKPLASNLGQFGNSSAQSGFNAARTQRPLSTPTSFTTRGAALNTTSSIRKPLPKDESRIIKRESDRISVPTFVKKTNREE